MIQARARQGKVSELLARRSAPRLVKKPRRQRASPSFRSGTAQASPVARSGSARFRRARWLTRQFATGSSPARYIAQASFRDLPCTRPQICRDSQRKNPCAPMVAVCKDLVAALLARLEPSLRFRFSLIALGGQRQNKMAARLRPARKLLARDAAHGQDFSNIGARRCLSPRTKAVAPRGFARCKPPALSVRPASFWSLR